MYAVKNPLKNDLESLYNNDLIHSAEQLNDFLGKTFFSERKPPMYFTGNFNAKTVFVMLNPGSSSDNCFSFNKLAKYKYLNLNDFYEKHIFEHVNYGKLDSCRMDNFDLKQAAFLYEFKDSDLELPDFFPSSKKEEVPKTVKLKAKENVLMNKLQLELIPYCSTEFKGLLDNSKQALKNIDVLIPHIERVFDSIISYQRKYVIFGAKQFYYLLKAYETKKSGTIYFYPEQNSSIKDLSKKVYWQLIVINYKDKSINALVPYSFPRRDLPNAYLQMREYGKLCYESFSREFL